MKIGVLYPRSNVYPNITADFVNGLKSCLKKDQLTDSTQLFLESIGFGGSEKEVYEKAEKLLLLDQVDLLVAYIDEKVTGILQPLLQASGKLALVVNSGANYPESWIATPNMLRLNLQDAFLCRLSGQLASGQENKEGLVATTFYDCGYLHLATMAEVFAQQGGQIVFNYINKYVAGETFHIKELAEFLNTHTTNNLLCLFDSHLAAFFYEQLNNLPQAEALHLFVSPMMLQPKALDNIGNGFKFSVDGYIPWQSSQENKANLDFTDNYREQTKQEPNIFALLGWEAGLVIKKLFDSCAGDYHDLPGASEIFIQTTIDSPRGKLKLDAASNYFAAPFLQCIIKKGSGTKEVIPIEFPMAEWEKYIQQPTDGSHSGWINTYLCY